jgi:NAD(P)-dependent dehydrogenase (short-subunit alcohol dehydrogenase family)
VQELRDQVAVITGGASGIGWATAQLFAAHGAHVALLDLDEHQGLRRAQELQKSGVKAVYHRCDVTRRSEVDAAVDAVLRSLGQIDVLVNNAGGSKTVWIWEMTEEQWDTMVNLNLKHAFLMCRAVIPHMMERRQGSIVNLSSCQAVEPAPMRAHYSAAKAGIIGFTRTVAAEVAPHKIRVNAVAPGPTNSERVRRNFTEEGWAQRNADHPLGRVAEPEDIAEGILFLAGPRARHITGHLLHVNGGLVMP